MPFRTGLGPAPHDLAASPEAAFAAAFLTVVAVALAGLVCAARLTTDRR